MDIRRLSMVAVLLSAAVSAYSQNTVPVDVTVDTGSHTCTKIGEDYKIYKDISAGAGRYFHGENLQEHSRFGAGNCVFGDGDGSGVTRQNFKFTDADGDTEIQSRVVAVTVRAYADCTNDPLKIGSQVGTECRFTATSKKGTQ